MSDVMRTADGCFTDLPNFPFEPHYLDDLSRSCTWSTGDE
jgi:hypothetical protein